METCPRSDCNDEFENGTPSIETYLLEKHLLLDHDPRREEVDNYPRPPEQR